MQFDNKISLGHIISIALVFFGGMTAYFDLRSAQTLIEAEVGSLSRAYENVEGRVRSGEIAQASQTSDLRSIQVGISEIKAALVKIGERP